MKQTHSKLTDDPTVNRKTAYKQRQLLERYILRMKRRDVLTVLSRETITQKFGTNLVVREEEYNALNVVKKLLQVLPKQNHAFNPFKQILISHLISNGFSPSLLLEWGVSKDLVYKVKNMETGRTFSSRKTRKRKFAGSPYDDQKIIKAAKGITRPEAGMAKAVCVGKDKNGEKIYEARHWKDENDGEFVRNLLSSIQEESPQQITKKPPGKTHVMEVIKKSKIFKNSEDFDYHNCEKCIEVKFNLKNIFTTFLPTHDTVCDLKECIFSSVGINVYPFNFFVERMCPLCTRTLDCYGGECNKCKCRLKNCLSEFFFHNCNAFFKIKLENKKIKQLKFERHEEKTKGGKAWFSTKRVYSYIPANLAIMNLQKAIAFYCTHIHVRRTTRAQEKNLGNKIFTNARYKDVVKSISDFGKGIVLREKKMSQNMFFHQRTVEIFLTVVDFLDATGTTEDPKMNRYSFVILSNSKAKTGDDVGHYLGLVEKKLVEMFKKQDRKISTWLDFSDGPPTQFKNGRCIKAFIFHTNSNVQKGKVFYASYHAQGLQDQEISVVKKIIAKGVRKFKKIDEIELLYEYLIKNGQPKKGKVKKRFFFIVDEKDILRQKKPPSLIGSKTNYFFTKNLKKKMHLLRRPIFCSCESCLFQQNEKVNGCNQKCGEFTSISQSARRI